ncbi:flagellar biosynthesis protein FlgA [Micromonospora sp. NPDC050397]|uniref:flagellar biosynthesis protein FlgA n=1 Tax=Micromonospora sp. NPDC050397 TaxID=3364279 RepID=UPI00385167E2
MAIRSGPARRSSSLSPSRWPTPPRRGTVLRLGLAAGLLSLAAATLYLREPPPACPAAPRPVPPAAGPTGPGSPGTPVAAGTRLPLPSGMVGVPVRLAEPAALTVVRPGARVDLLVVPTGGAAGPGRAADSPPIAAHALVLDVLGTTDAAVEGSALYLALPPEQARRTVALPDGTRFAILVRE